MEKHCIVFFVDDFRIAEKLQGCDRNIQMYDGFKLPVRVRPGTPQVPIDDAYKEKIKLAMVKRYNVNTRALDLSKFNADPDFKSMFFTLARPQMMSAVLDIIEKNIPDLVALNLNDNQMVTMESFKNITQRLPHLKILYLDENRVGRPCLFCVIELIGIFFCRFHHSPICWSFGMPILLNSLSSRILCDRVIKINHSISGINLCIRNEMYSGGTCTRRCILRLRDTNTIKALETERRRPFAEMSKC